jgi:hypothetical protein
MNPFQPFTVQLSPFVPNPIATQTYIFFSIYDATGHVIFNDGFLSASTTSLSIPAGTLSPNANYKYELIFSDRDTVPSPGATFNADLLFDVRTDGLFSTIPEPSTLILAALGGLALVAYRRRG